MAYFATFSTYGTHLPGDARGSTDRNAGRIQGQSALERRGGEARSVQGSVDSLLVYILDGQGDRMEIYDGSDPTANAVG